MSNGFIMNELIKEIARQSKIPDYHLEYGTELCIAPHLEKFAELLLKESFTIIKTAMVNEDMLAVDEVIANRLDEAACDVCDQLGLLGPIYEGVDCDQKNSKYGIGSNHV
jgi:hypothetical protein